MACAGGLRRPPDAAASPGTDDSGDQMERRDHHSNERIAPRRSTLLARATVAGNGGNDELPRRQRPALLGIEARGRTRTNAKGEEGKLTPEHMKARWEVSSSRGAGIDDECRRWSEEEDDRSVVAGALRLELDGVDDAADDGVAPRQGISRRG